MLLDEAVVGSGRHVVGSGMSLGQACCWMRQLLGQACCWMRQLLGQAGMLVSGMLLGQAGMLLGQACCWVRQACCWVRHVVGSGGHVVGSGMLGQVGMLLGQACCWVAKHRPTTYLLKLSPLLDGLKSESVISRSPVDRGGRYCFVSLDRSGLGFSGFQQNFLAFLSNHWTKVEILFYPQQMTSEMKRSLS